MILDIVTWPDKRLRMVSEEVVDVDDSIRELIENMEKTLYSRHGAGISAIQVGEPKRIFLIDAQVDGSSRKADSLVFVNPKIEYHGKPSTPDAEGCLSFPETFVRVPRYESVTVVATNKYGTEFDLQAYGFLARVIQHEFDHLEGKLILDYAPRHQKERIKKKLKKRLRE